MIRKRKILLLLIQALLLTTPLFSQEQNSIKKEVPGLVYSMETLIKVARNQYNNLRTTLAKNPAAPGVFNSFVEFNFNPIFLNAILFFSEPRFSSMINTENECLLYSLLQNNLLKGPNGKIEGIIIDGKNSKGESQTIIVEQNEFIEKIHQKKCFANKEIGVLFSEKNLPHTINAINIQNPKSLKTCQSTVESWRKNAYTPFLCSLNEKINEVGRAKIKLQLLSDKNVDERRTLNQSIQNGEKLQSLIPGSAKSFINNLCSNLDDASRFCRLYLDDNIWAKVLAGDAPPQLMSYKCAELLNNPKISPNNFPECRDKMEKNPKLCTNYVRTDRKALFPSPSCDEIGFALNSGHLRPDYHDCPGLMDNDAITNIHRLLMHLKPRAVNQSPAACAAETNLSFAQLNLDFSNKSAWPVSLCYYYPVLAKEFCEAYVPGFNPDSPLSESRVVGKILAKLKAAPPETVCRLTSSNRFNPTLLSYKSGCYIVYNELQCTALNCPKKIIWDNKEIKEIKYTGLPIFDYFPNSFNNVNFTQKFIIEEAMKVKSTQIKNLTELTYYLDQNPKGIIQGIACAEDLLPAYFSKRSFNQCSPLPFIVDGYLKKNESYYVTTRTSIDDVHSPRLILWNFLFASIKSYSERHPLNTWSFYGVK